MSGFEYALVVTVLWLSAVVVGGLWAGEYWDAGEALLFVLISGVFSVVWPLSAVVICLIAVHRAASWLASRCASIWRHGVSGL